MAKRAPILARAIRAAIDANPRTLHRIAKDATLPYSTVHRSSTHERTELNLRTASVLCDTLGLELRPVRRKGR